MSESIVQLETVFELASSLSPVDKVRLVERLAATLERDLASETVKKPKRSSYGALADLNLDVSEEDIDEIRREMLANFPREDIAR